MVLLDQNKLLQIKQFGVMRYPEREACRKNWQGAR